MTLIKEYKFTIQNSKGDYQTLYEIHYSDGSVYVVDRHNRVWIPWERKSLSEELFGPVDN